MRDHLMQQRAALAAHAAMQQAAYLANAHPPDGRPTDAREAVFSKTTRRKAGRGIAAPTVEG